VGRKGWMKVWYDGRYSGKEGVDESMVRRKVKWEGRGG